MAENDVNKQQMAALIDQLCTLHVDGPSRGGPYVGIVHNDLTREILGVGKVMIKPLLERLPDSNFDEAVYIVFLLRKLRAVEAQSTVQKVQSEIEERSVGRDLTLKMQVEFYWRDLESEGWLEPTEAQQDTLTNKRA